MRTRFNPRVTQVRRRASLSSAGMVVGLAVALSTAGCAPGDVPPNAAPESAHRYGEERSDADRGWFGWFTRLWKSSPEDASHHSEALERRNRRADNYGPPLPPHAVVEPRDEVPPPYSTGSFSEPPLGSLAPDHATAAERVPSIVERGRIIIGVDQSQYLLSFRNGRTGELSGFEVDLAHEIARDIFGDPTKVDLRFVGSTDRVEALRSGRVDAIIRTMTITRARQNAVEFSIPYLRTTTRLAVYEHSGIRGVADLKGRRVCTTEDSTLLDLARRLAPEATKLRVNNWADCLMALQQHQVDAIMSDDVILAGLAAQDPSTVIVGDGLSEENYGVAVAKPASPAEAGLVRQINATLERLFHDGSWQRLHDTWLKPSTAVHHRPRVEYRSDEDTSLGDAASPHPPSPSALPPTSSATTPRSRKERR